MLDKFAYLDLKRLGITLLVVGFLCMMAYGLYYTLDNVMHELKKYQDMKDQASEPSPNFPPNTGDNPLF